MKYILTIFMTQVEKLTKQISLSDPKLEEGPAGKEENCRILQKLKIPPYPHVWHHKSYQTPWASYRSQQIPKPQKQTSLTCYCSMADIIVLLNCQCLKEINCLQCFDKSEYLVWASWRPCRKSAVLWRSVSHRVNRTRFMMTKSVKVGKTKFECTYCLLGVVQVYNY